MFYNFIFAAYSYTYNIFLSFTLLTRFFRHLRNWLQDARGKKNVGQMIQRLRVRSCKLSPAAPQQPRTLILRVFL